MNVLDYYIVSS